MKVSPLCYVSCLACLIASASIRAAACAGVSPSRSRPCTASALRLSRIRSPSGSGLPMRCRTASSMYACVLCPAAAAACLICAPSAWYGRIMIWSSFAMCRADALRCASVVLIIIYTSVYSIPYTEGICNHTSCTYDSTHLCADCLLRMLAYTCYHIVTASDTGPRAEEQGGRHEQSTYHR